MRIYYQLTTIDPVIVSQNTASTNTHECLDYIPGSAILGALASEHYPNMTEEESWETFHNGAVKFGPCYALVNKQIALPIPASWHFEKDTQPVDDNKFKIKEISNHTAVNFNRDSSKQYKQCRDGYVNGQGFIAEIKQGNTTKTALDSKTGSAKEQQLFSYSYLSAQQKFVGWIACENEKILNQLKTSLNKILHIGRSRNTEFGRVSLEVIEVSAPKINNNPHELVLWCLSDCEFINELGMPTLIPKGIDIHEQLKDATLNPARSFIRTRAVSLFNQKRQGFDSEQILISKGSVLTFDLITPLTDEQLKELNQGVGVNQQYGLGWVSINPSWTNIGDLTGNELFSAYSITSNNSIIPKKIKTNSPLTTWLTSQIEQQNNKKASQERVNKLAIHIINLYKNARRYNFIINSNEAGPSATQWGRIRMAVSQNDEQWHDIVFNGDNAICKANNDELGWGIKVQSMYGQSNFADEFKKLLVSESVYTMRLLIEQLGRYDLSIYKQLKKAIEAFPEGVEV